MSYFGLIRGFRSSDSTAQPLRLDKSTNTIQNIEYEHHEIHSGSSFTACYKAELGNGASADLLVVTPNTTSWAHMIYKIDVEAEADITVYEAPTATPGTAITAYNRNRNSATAATTTVTHTPTEITEGTTIISSAHIGSGRDVGGGSRGTHEFVLKQNTKYLYRVTNATTTNNYVSIKLDWYEHTNIA